MIREQKELKLTVTFDEKNSETESRNQLQQNQQQPSQDNGGFYYQWPFSGMFPW